MFNYEGKTSGIKNFMTETFLANKWVKPNQELVYDFFKQIKSFYAQIDANIAENNHLTKQRDEFLPLLMNGQVSVNYHLSAMRFHLIKYSKTIGSPVGLPIVVYVNIVLYFTMFISSMRRLQPPNLSITKST